MKKKVLLGMSGGVDSSVAAIILKEQGYEVIGATMELWKNGEDNGCGSSVAAIDAKMVCDNLGLEHIVLDFRDKFKECVINNFIDSYKRAVTPNPCIECNKHLKFREFYKKAEEFNCDYIATGHYARTEFSDIYNQYILKKSNAGKKDQSYVLYSIDKTIIGKILFPLGQFEDKIQIRQIAEKYNLDVAQKSDSQEICFIPDNNYAKFLTECGKLKSSKGEIVDKNGKVIGVHKGLINYTVGQRKGLGISSKNPLYIIELDDKNNKLIVGEEKDIYSKVLYANNLNFILDIDKSKPIKVQAKIRYSAKEAEAILYPKENETVKVEFTKAQRAITKGQSVVFYIDNIVLGGGIIL